MKLFQSEQVRLDRSRRLAGGAARVPYRPCFGSLHLRRVLCRTGTRNRRRQVMLAPLLLHEVACVVPNHRRGTEAAGQLDDGGVVVAAVRVEAPNLTDDVLAFVQVQPLFFLVVVKVVVRVDQFEVVFGR